MKVLFYGLLTLSMAAPVFAENKGLNAKEAQLEVSNKAQAYIKKNAPDWGGQVNSPCDAKLTGVQNFT